MCTPNPDQCLWLRLPALDSAHQVGSERNGKEKGLVLTISHLRRTSGALLPFSGFLYILTGLRTRKHYLGKAETCTHDKQMAGWISKPHRSHTMDH
ncbi:tudor domain-containing protein 15 isoform X4 [Pteropus medius]|uniref:tudor domain-containing protein 15 isoform X4 n=1 Tax=Pteropus vampyrus TaxID=132908 RepID=UPI00196AD0DD|nr:tudor domain-containing protein 15 isoform X4 [Pteropus giganteus]